MIAKFYSKSGKLVWECTTDAKYHLHNGTTAMNKGAYRGVLYDAQGNEIDALTYGL